MVFIFVMVVVMVTVSGVKVNAGVVFFGVDARPAPMTKPMRNIAKTLMIDFKLISSSPGHFLKYYLNNRCNKSYALQNS